MSIALLPDTSGERIGVPASRAPRHWRLPPPAFWCGRSDDHRRVTWIELFFDLVFVAAVAQVGTPLRVDYGFDGLMRYAFLLSIIWWAWNGYALYATRFDSDDGLQRGLTLAQMVAVIFMAANAEDGLDSISSAGFAAAYALMRLILVVQYLRALALPEARRLAGECAAGFGAAALIWLVSSVVPPPARYVLWAIALMVDVGTAVAASRHTEALPPDASHLPERFGLFTLILLGESIVAIMKGVQGQPDWTMPAAASALLGIGMIFSFWWWYFDGARAAAERPIRSRDDRRRFDLWHYAHLPLYFGLALVGVGIEAIVHNGGALRLGAEQTWVLCLAAVLVMASLSILMATTTRIARHATRILLPLSFTPLLLPALLPQLPAVAIVAALGLLAIVQAGVAVPAVRRIALREC